MEEPFGCSQCTCRCIRTWYRQITRHSTTWMRFFWRSAWIFLKGTLAVELRPSRPWFAHRAHPYVLGLMPADDLKQLGATLSRMQISLAEPETVGCSSKGLHLTRQLAFITAKDFKQVDRFSHSSGPGYMMMKFLL